MTAHDIEIAWLVGRGTLQALLVGTIAIGLVYLGTLALGALLDAREEDR